MQANGRPNRPPCRPLIGSASRELAIALNSQSMKRRAAWQEASCSPPFCGSALFAELQTCSSLERTACKRPQRISSKPVVRRAHRPDENDGPSPRHQRNVIFNRITGSLAGHPPKVVSALSAVTRRDEARDSEESTIAGLFAASHGDAPCREVSQIFDRAETCHGSVDAHAQLIDACGACGPADTKASAFF